jgi:hypothetical protein
MDVPVHEMAMGGFPDPNPQLDPKSVFIAAGYYQDGATVLNMALSPQVPSRFFPWSVLCAFSLELYLKCLLIMENGNAPETHNLKELFRNLKRQTKAELKKQYYLKMQTDPVGKMRLERGEAVDLESDLETSKDAFVRMRYAYEGNLRDGAGFNVGVLANRIREHVLKIHPDWA